jgi:hypothetical protein
MHIKFSIVRGKEQIIDHPDILRPCADCLGGCNYQMPNFQRIDIWVLN